MGEYGARRIGETGLTGIAPALTMAKYDVTGVRDLPICKLLERGKSLERETA
jgi:CO/xanthine dehydrogenase Mo-binding subunit